MKRLGRLLIWTLAIGAALVLGIGVGFTLWFDGERAGARISAFLSTRLAQPVSLQRVSLVWSPLPGIQVDGINVGKTRTPLARADSALLQLRLLPLLERRLHLASVTLDGLVLELPDTSAPALPVPPPGGGTPAPEEDKPAANRSVVVDELRIRNASLGMAGDAPQRLDNVSLTAGPLALGVPATLSLQGRLDGTLKGPLTLDGIVTVASDGRWQLTDTTLALGEGSLSAPAVLTLDLLGEPDSARLSIPAFELSGPGVRIEGELQVTGLDRTPQLAGRLVSTELPARALLDELGIDAPADPTALSQVSVELQVSGTPESLILSPTARVDDSTLSGSLTLSPGPEISLDLEIDRLALDRYAPTATPATVPISPGSAVAAASVAKPLLPANLDLDGELRVGTLWAADVRVEALRIPLALHDGILDLQPSANLYGGRYQGKIGLDGSRVPAHLSLDEQLRGVQAGPLLEALAGEARISGRTDLDARLSMVPGDADTLRRSLDGELRLVFHDGAYRGVNLAQLLRGVEAVLEGRPPPRAAGVLRTDFTELSGTFRLRDGEVHNDDLLGKSPFLRVQGRGNANLLSKALDYRLTVVLVRTPEGQDGMELARLTGIPVPVRVTGALGEPRFRLDTEALVREHGQRLLDGHLDDLADEVEEELRDHLDGNLDEQLEQEAERLLQGLFR